MLTGFLSSNYIIKGLTVSNPCDTIQIKGIDGINPESWFEMKRVFCSFTEDEYIEMEKKSKELGMSVAKLVEYATALYVDMPRTQIPNLHDIKKKIDDFLSRDDVDTFICSTPFDNWPEMTTSSKRTAATQMRKLVDDGVIEKVDPASKSHKAAIYRKVTK